MEALQEVIKTSGGLPLLVLLLPAVALGVFAGVFGFMWFKTMPKNAHTTLKHSRSNSTIQALGQGLVLREEYESMLSSLRKQLGLLASGLSELSERLARVETKQDAVDDDRRSKDRRK